MPSQALAFAELAVGGVLLAMGITDEGPREILAGQGKHVAPIGAAGSSGAGGGGKEDTAFHGAAGASYPFPGWTRSRTDQGVDFYGGRRILAPEAGKIERLGPYGGAGGGFGPGGVLLHTVSGKFIYFYEGLTPAVAEGAQVNAGDLIAHGIPGGSIEAGFANASGQPLAASEYTEGAVTKWGKKFLEWLNLLNAPPSTAKGVA